MRKVSRSIKVNSKNKLSAGLEYLDEKLESESDNISNKTLYTMALYAQDEWTIAESLQAVVGLRYIYNETFEDHFTPTASIMYREGGFRGRLSFATGFRTPTLSEIYATDLAKTTNRYTIGNLELKPEEMEKNNIRFQAKYKEIEENEVRFEEIHCEDAEYLIVAFGSMARIGQKAMEMAREEGLKVGMLRPITLWPFPTKAIAAYADKVKGILVTELNAGQMIEDVRLAVNGKVKVEHFGRLGGIVPDPDEIVEALAKLKIEG